MLSAWLLPWAAKVARALASAGSSEPRIPRSSRTAAAVNSLHSPAARTRWVGGSSDAPGIRAEATSDSVTDKSTARLKPIRLASGAATWKARSTAVCVPQAAVSFSRAAASPGFPACLVSSTVSAICLAVRPRDAASPVLVSVAALQQSHQLTPTGSVPRHRLCPNGGGVGDATYEQAHQQHMALQVKSVAQRFDRQLFLLPEWQFQRLQLGQDVLTQVRYGRTGCCLAGALANQHLL